MHDVVIVGAGHNGLVAAASLAKAGRKTLVLERSARVGGCAVTLEIAPGFRCSPIANRAALDPGIIRALDLERHGLRILRPLARMCAPTGEGRALTLWEDTGAAAGEIAAFSRHDAERYPQFLESMAAVSGVLRRVAAKPAPSVGRPAAMDLLHLLNAGKEYRALSKANAYRLLRWLPMAVADLTHEWFDSEPLCATVAAGGVMGSFVGPRSPGSAAVLLWLGAGDGHPIAPGWFAKGGMGGVTEALAAAARQGGAEIRIGAEVSHIAVRDGAVSGVVLSTGEEVPARSVVSNADPHRTMIGLVDPVHLPPDYAQAIRHIRMRGTLATVSYAVSSMPAFRDLSGWDPARQAAALSGGVRLTRNLEAIERAFDAAKYGSCIDQPWIELTIPSILDPGLAPPGAHVVTAHVLYAPYHLRDGDWDTEREKLGNIVTRTIAGYAPGFERTVVARSVVTPLDLERDYGLTGGHVFHGELALDQLFLARPVYGWARHRTPVRNLFLCGGGTHPGSGLDGRAGWLAARAVLKS